MSKGVHYSFDEATLLLNKGSTHVDLAKRYGYASHSGFTRKYNRDLRNQTQAVNQQHTRQKKDTVSLDKSRSTDTKKSALEYHQNLELSDIRRMKYGELEPTHYISDLAHSDWLPYYLGKFRYRWDLPYLRDLQDMMWNDTETIAHIFRAGGKTTQYLGMTTRELLEIRKPHMTICSPKRPRILFRQMDLNITKNPLVRKHYGDILEVTDGRVQSNKSELMMWLHDDFDYPYLDPLYRAASRETDIIGSRPWKIHIEDPTQSESPNETEKLKIWYPDVVSPMISMEKGERARILATATRKDPNDFSSYLMLEEKFNELHHKSIRGIIPARHDVVFDLLGNVVYMDDDTIDAMDMTNPHIDPLELTNRYFKNPVSFASQYQNEPVAREGAFFDRDDWHINTEYLTSNYMYKLWIDPARGKTASSSDSALIVTSNIYHALVVVDCIVGKFLPNQLEREAYLLAKKWNVSETKAENNFAQITRSYDPYSLIFSLPGFRVFDTKLDKIDRIRATKGAHNNRRIQYHEACGSLDKIEYQFFKFDSNAKGKWDILDIVSTAYGMEIWGNLEAQQSNYGWGVV